MSGQFLDTTLAAQFKRPYRNCPDHTNLSPALPLRGSPDRDLSFIGTNLKTLHPVPVTRFLAIWSRLGVARRSYRVGNRYMAKLSQAWKCREKQQQHRASNVKRLLGRVGRPCE